MTMQSGAIVCRLRAVSSRVSPFDTLEVETLMLTASADKRFAAISNEVRVRVDGSKKRLITVRPRSAGTFLISRFEMSRNVSAVSSRWMICSGDNSRMPSRCFIYFELCALYFVLLCFVRYSIAQFDFQQIKVQSTSSCNKKAATKAAS